MKLAGLLPPVSVRIVGLPSGRKAIHILHRSDGDHSSELVTELRGKDISLTENSSNTRTKIEKFWLFPVLFILSAVSCRVYCENIIFTLYSHYRK